MFALALLLAPAAGFAQNVPAQGPLVVERVHSPVVVAPDYKVTDLDGEFGQLAGAYVGRAIDGALFIGGAGYWLVNGSGGDELAYGGVLTGWSMPVGGRIRFGARGLVGFGRATLETDFDVVRGFDGGRGGGIGETVPATSAESRGSGRAAAAHRCPPSACARKTISSSSNRRPTCSHASPTTSDCTGRRATA